MQTSNNAALNPASFLQDPLSCRHYTTRYVIRTEDGFLAACTGIGGVPVEVVPDPLSAVRFADLDTAAYRARALLKLGWDHHLRIVALRVPMF
jgi:hypothetical protein